MQGRKIYLDNLATTPIDSRVLDAMLPYLTDKFGNAASRSHVFGLQAASAVDEARTTILRAVNADANSRIIFTSSATESINLAFKGLRPGPGANHVITTQIEHKAVLQSCKFLKKSKGVSVTDLPVDQRGVVDLNQLTQSINDDTYLISIMVANNEIGTIQEIKTIGSLCRENGIIFHTDATQAVGKIPFDVQELNIDLASFTAHKMYGPKGVGALYVANDRIGERLTPQIDGAGQENNYRSGTLNVPGIVGFARAIEICVTELHEQMSHTENLRNQLSKTLADGLDEVCVNGHQTSRLPGLCNITFASVNADVLMSELSEIALSSGSACISGRPVVSHVLKAIGLSDELARASIRFGIGRFNTEEEIQYTAKRCIEAVRELRAGGQS
jgi:cysteine desulfurase